MSKLSFSIVLSVIFFAAISVWLFNAFSIERPKVQGSKVKATVSNNSRNSNNSVTPIPKAKDKDTTTGTRRVNDASSNLERVKKENAIIDQRIFGIYNDYSEAIADPENYAAIKASAMRARLIKDQIFFRNQNIPPEVRGKLLSALVDKDMENIEIASIAAGDRESSVAARSINEDEYNQKLDNILGDDMANRYRQYTQNPVYWKELDTYVAVTADRCEPLSDDQKYAITTIMSENKTDSWTDLKDQIMPLLSPDQQNAYESFLKEEEIVTHGKNLEEELRQKITKKLSTQSSKNANKK